MGGGERQPDKERGAFARRAHDRDRAAVLLDDPIGDGQAQARAFPDLLGGEERIEDPPLQPGRNPVAGVGERDLHRRGADRARNANRLARRVGHRVARIRQQVDEDLLELDGIAYDHGLLRTKLERDLDRAQAELLLHEGKRSLDHVPQGDRFAADGGRPPERAQVRDDLRGLADLLRGLTQLADDLLLVRPAELDEVDRVAHEQADVVQGIVELVGDAGGELAENGKLAGLDELLLFVAQLVFAPPHLGRGLLQVSHDVNHRLAAGFQTQLVLVRILKDMQNGPPRIVESSRLAGQPPAVLLIVGQDVQHGFPLVGEALVGLGQVEQGAALLVDARHGAHTLPALGRPSSFRRLSSSFSRAIIFSSRPTTTSSNFSRSRIFSCSSLLDCSRSRTTCSYSRMSRKMPMAPITLPSGSRRAEALRVVGITSPLALRGLRRAFRVTPRATTSRSAAVNSRVSSGLMKRESDCSRTSSGRKPRRADTASLACRIFPSRSETNTGSGALAIKLSA